MAALLRNGHSRVFEYGYSFVRVCSEELAEFKNDELFRDATAARLASLQTDDWKKFADEHTKKEKKPIKKEKKKQMTIEEHRAIARRLAGI